jgi:hypothetical protein
LATHVLTTAMPHLKIWPTDWCRESRDISRI